MKASFLTQTDHPIRPTSQLFGLGIGRLNFLVLEQGGDEVSHQGRAVAGSPVELPSCFQVAHRVLSFGFRVLSLELGRGPETRNSKLFYAVSFSLACLRLSISSLEGKLSIFIPSSKPISRRISLISLSDLWPKFLVRSISCSDFCTSSPIYLISAFCRQFWERTENSSSSTLRNRFSLRGPKGFSSRASRWGSSSKLIKICS